MANEAQPLVPCRAYVMRGILYLPHYTKRNVFVAPGGAEFDVSYMTVFRADPIILNLWPRGPYIS